MKNVKRIFIVIFIISLILTSFAFVIPNTPAVARNGNPFLMKTLMDEKGNQIDMVVFPSKPPEARQPKNSGLEPVEQLTISTLSDVPAFDWSYGCSATSAAMLFGYYDRQGYPNMYSGNTNGGVCPLTNEIWGYTVYPSVTCWEAPLSATHQTIDGLVSRGHVDDYWVDYGHSGDDPYVNNWQEHSYQDCTADFMGTNQDQWNNVDGGTTFFFSSLPVNDYTGSEGSGLRDGCHGMRLFAESRGYTVAKNYNQYIKGYTGSWFGFTFDNYKAEINAGRPVLIQVEGHTMVGYGYDATNNTVYLRNTWDWSYDAMTWGGVYEGMRHFGVTVFQLEAPTSPVAPVAAFTASPLSGAAPLTVNFTDQSSNSPTSWTWDFGDGSTSTSQNPSHIYSNPGTYTVSLTATNTGGSDEETKTDYIAVSSTLAPVAAFTANPTSGIAPLTVNFTDQSTNFPTSWTWDFGDGGTSTSQNPSHIYSNPGTYTVSLTATNTGGSDEETKTDYIAVDAVPVSSITVTSPSGGVWIKGASMPINWNSSNVIGNVKISLSRNGGATWTTIAKSTANDGVYDWKVTRPATTNAVIKVSSINDPSVFGISAVFIIK